MRLSRVGQIASAKQAGRRPVARLRRGKSWLYGTDKHVLPVLLRRTFQNMFVSSMFVQHELVRVVVTTFLLHSQVRVVCGEGVSNPFPGTPTPSLLDAASFVGLTRRDHSSHCHPIVARLRLGFGCSSPATMFRPSRPASRSTTAINMVPVELQLLGGAQDPG